MLKQVFILGLAIILSSCGGGGGGTPATSGTDNTGNTENTTPGNTTGTVTLSGDDTVLVGTQLDTGFVGASPAAGSQPDYIVIVDKDSTVSFTEPNILTPDISNPQNAFILVVTDASAVSGYKGISMSIITNGVKYDYACTSPVSTFIECGLNTIKLDIASKKISFLNTVVTNVASSSILVLNGELSW